MPRATARAADHGPAAANEQIKTNVQISISLSPSLSRTIFENDKSHSWLTVLLLSTQRCILLFSFLFALIVTCCHLTRFAPPLISFAPPHTIFINRIECELPLNSFLSCPFLSYPKSTKKFHSFPKDNLITCFAFVFTGHSWRF